MRGGGREVGDDIEGAIDNEMGQLSLECAVRESIV